MKIALIGANGQLGSEIYRQFIEKNEVVPLTHQDIEVSDFKNLKQILGTVKPNVVINTSGYHVVPKCEENPEMAFKVNGIGALNLAKLSEVMDFQLVHYSTDYVFDGSKMAPYIEDDTANPLNVYAMTKLAGEYFISNYSESYYIIRVSGLYGQVPCRAKGGNFITTMIRLAEEKPLVKVVNDEILTPTSVSEIAHSSLSLLETGMYGLYHMTCEGHCSWYDFARVIFKTLSLKTPLEECSVKDFPSTVKRPVYSVLENKNFKKLNLDDLAFWRDALITHLKKML